MAVILVLFSHSGVPFPFSSVGVGLSVGQFVSLKWPPPEFWPQPIKACRDTAVNSLSPALSLTSANVAVKWVSTCASRRPPRTPTQTPTCAAQRRSRDPWMAFPVAHLRPINRESIHQSISDIDPSKASDLILFSSWVTRVRVEIGV